MCEIHVQMSNYNKLLVWILINDLKKTLRTEKQHFHYTALLLSRVISTPPMRIESKSYWFHHEQIQALSNRRLNLDLRAWLHSDKGVVFQEKTGWAL